MEDIQTSKAESNREDKQEQILKSKMNDVRCKRYIIVLCGVAYYTGVEPKEMIGDCIIDQATEMSTTDLIKWTKIIDYD